MAELTIPPTPPTAQVFADDYDAGDLPTVTLPQQPTNGSNGAIASSNSRTADIISRIINFMLLPLRLLGRLALDIREALIQAFYTLWESALGSVFLALLLSVLAVESFGENFFLGEMFQKLFPSMKSFVQDASAVGGFLTMLFPFFGELRASTVFAFVISVVSVAAMALFFHFLEESKRQELHPVAQEVLLLDSQFIEEVVDEHALAQPESSTKSLSILGMYAIGGVQLILLGFETAALIVVLDSALFGVLSALLLLVLRVVIGYVAHLCLKKMWPHFAAAVDHARICVSSVLGIVPNLINEALRRLEVIFSP